MLLREEGIPPLGDKNARRLLIFAWMFVIASIAFTFLDGIGGLYRRFHPESPAVQAQKLFKDPMSVTKHVRVNGVDYDIPVPYFRRRVPRETEDIQIYLVWMYPDFLPLQKSESELFREKNNDVISTLSHDLRSIRTIEWLADFARTNAHRTVITGHQYGLEIYDPEDQRGDGRLVPYISREPNEQVATVIQCSEEWIKGSSGGTRYPYCNHYFEDGFLRHQITYKKHHLPHWKEIEDKTRALFEEFRKSAKEKNLDKVVIPPERVVERAKDLNNANNEKGGTDSVLR